ncbi:MAG: beta-lactamase family protein [Chitinophagaceae bacterium]|nr:beta-lactamase family protein [Chitinophagaceae bacterium]
MPLQTSRTLFLAGFLYILSSCVSNGEPKPKLAMESFPKFGKVNISYNDTTDPKFKEMIYQLDTFYQRQISLGFNGSVLVGYKGKILYKRYFGIADRENNILWDEQTQSQLASTSKPFTAGAILILKDKGLLGIDDPVNKYISYFPYPEITLRMLLNHRSGLPDYLKLMTKAADKPYLCNDDVLSWLAVKRPKLNFTSDTKFTYCNTNYVVLASVIEKVTGMKFDYFMKRFLFTPLGMTNTFVVDPNDIKNEHTANSYNYRWKLEPNMHFDGVWGDKGVYSTVEDLYRWDQALYSGKLIKSSTLSEAYRGYSFEKEGVKNYGLGWRMLDYPNGTKIIYHNGWWHGNNTSFYRFIDDNFTIIVLGNRFNKNIYRQPQQIYNIINGQMVNGEEIETEE